jgi:hypothetical protein
MINDYSTLQSAIARWLARADLSQSIPDFIQLAEIRINKGLRVNAQQITVTGTSSDSIIALPSDFRQSIVLFITDYGQERELKPANEQRAPIREGVVSGYVVEGTNIRLIGGIDAPYRLVYYAGVPSLADATPQNWLIQASPDLYLWASLLEACTYLQDDDRAPLFGQKYQIALDELTKQDAYMRFAPSPRQRVDFLSP